MAAPQSTSRRNSDPTEQARAFRWELTRRALDRQAALLDGVRTRASILLAAAGLVASLIGADRLKNATTDHPVAFTFIMLALAATTLSLLCSVGAVLPVHDRKGKLNTELEEKTRLIRIARIFTRRTRPGTPREWQLSVLDDDIAHLGTPTEIIDCLLEELSPARIVNWTKLADLNWLLTAASALLLLQVLFWAMALVFRSA